MKKIMGLISFYFLSTSSVFAFAYWDCTIYDSCDMYAYGSYRVRPDQGTYQDAMNAGYEYADRVLHLATPKVICRKVSEGKKLSSNESDLLDVDINAYYDSLGQ